MSNLIVAGIIFLVVFYIVFKGLLYIFKVNSPVKPSEDLAELKDVIQQFQQQPAKPERKEFSTSEDLKQKKSTSAKRKKSNKFIDL